MVVFSLTTSSRIEPSLLAARSRAARGIRFRILTFAMGSEGRGACAGALLPFVEWTEESEAWAGVHLEPRQRLVTGPCVRISPSLVTGISRWHTEQGARSVLGLVSPSPASLAILVGDSSLSVAGIDRIKLSNLRSTLDNFRQLTRQTGQTNSALSAKQVPARSLARSLAQSPGHQGRHLFALHC